MDISLASALKISLLAGLLAVVVDLLPAIWVARLLARPRLRGRAVLSALVHLPVVLPPVVTGYLLLLLFGRHGPLGRLGLHVAFTFAGCVVAAAVVAFPFLVAALRAALEAVDGRLAGLAQTLGDTPLRAFLRVTLPLAAPGLLAGVVLGYARALGEFGATIVLAGSLPGETQTLATAVYALLDLRREKEALVFCAVAVGVAAVALLGYELLLDRQRRRRP